VAIRNEAILALRLAGADGEKILVPILIKILGEPAYRTQAAQTLMGVGPDSAKQALPQFALMLNETDPSACLLAAQALIRFGGEKEKKAAGDALVAIVRSRRSPYHMTAAQMLMGMGPEWKKAALDVYREMLAAPELNTRRFAVRVLIAQGGPDDRKATIPVLVEVMKTGREVERIQAAELLARADPETIPEVVKFLKEYFTDPQLRNNAMNAVHALIRLGPNHSAGAVPTLRAMLRESSPNTRNEAAGLLGELGPGGT
jgi:HEAT repeat protein